MKGEPEGLLRFGRCGEAGLEGFPRWLAAPPSFRELRHPTIEGQSIVKPVALFQRVRGTRDGGSQDARAPRDQVKVPALPGIR